MHPDNWELQSAVLSDSHDQSLMAFTNVGIGNSLSIKLHASAVLTDGYKS